MLDFLKLNENHVVVLIGAILDQNLHEEITEIVKQAKLSSKFIIHDVIEHNEFQNLFKEVQFN